MKLQLLFLFLFWCTLSANSQNPVNGFAKVTAISGASLSLSNVNETYDTFEDGEYVVIMQMQDNVIGTNTINASSFGDVSAILSAGVFEIGRISTHTESSSIPTSITLANSLANTYNINTNSSVQLISFNQLGSNFVSTANIGTSAWTGSVGGVTAIWVPGTFTLKHSLSADGAGFKGGVKNTPNGYSTCRSGTYIASASATYYAGKGEGIYKNTNANFGGARGKIANGGGGGNDTNAGGGGGNFLSGGDGGSGWIPAGTGCSPSSGGLGGLSLNSSISSSRVFMGGGGGGGHENDGVGTVGGNGGGIILLRTNTLVTSACSGVAISANGIAAATAANDGAGGGGAGGSIIMQVDSYSVISACHLTVSANGGNGGNSNTGGSDAHGGGGGGGQGVVIYSTPQPTTNITTNTIPGNGGVSCGACSATLNGSTGSGTSNTGIVPNATGGPLPVELLSFDATAANNSEVLLTWATAIEKNNDRFVLQRMNAEGVIAEFASVKAKGNYSSYSYTDLQAGNGTNYYRLKQVDTDGSVHLRNWVSVSLIKAPGGFSIYPNPTNSSGYFTVESVNMYNQPVLIELLNLTGQVKFSQTLVPDSNDHKLNISLDGLPVSVYFVMFSVNGVKTIKKLVVAQ